MALPFQLEWLGEIVKETTTFIYFTFTGYTFRPGAEKNPYLQLKQNDEESSNLQKISKHDPLAGMKFAILATATLVTVSVFPYMVILFGNLEGGGH